MKRANPDRTSFACDAGEDLRRVRLALAGDRGAARYVAEVLGRARAVIDCKNHKLGQPISASDLADVAQDVSVAAWSKLARFDGRVTLVQWMCGFVAVEMRRSRQRRARRREVFGEVPELAAREAPGLDTELVRAALEELAAVERTPVRMKFYGGLTFEEIAARLCISSNTVRTRYYRGIDRLRRKLTAGLRASV